MAGLLPCLLLTGLFMLYVGARALCNSSLAPKERVEKSDPTPYGRLAADLLPFAGLITLVMGSLYLGFATPDRKRGVVGKSLSVSVDLGGRRLIKKKTQKQMQIARKKLIV